MRDMFYLQIKKVMRNYTDLNFLMKNLSVNELRSDVKLENKKADLRSYLNRLATETKNLKI